MRVLAVALFLIVLAFVFLGALAVLVLPPAVEASRNLAYPMAAQATEPPPQPDLGAGPGFMYDATRWTAYVVDGEVALCSLETGCSLLPVGTILLLPALADSL